MNSDDMRRGIIPGVIAGYVFLAYAGPDITVNFTLHIIISIVVGALYTGVFMLYVKLGNRLVDTVVGGLIYGLIWWIIGWNIIMPIVADDPVLRLSIGPSFYGHIIFGHVLAFLVVLRDAAMGWAGMEYISTRNVEQLPQLKHPAGYVYNILGEARPGRVKIGRTVNPKQRMQQLQREHGKQLRYSSVMKSDNAPKDEHRMHKKFAAKRKDGEWFDLDQE